MLGQQRIVRAQQQRQRQARRSVAEPGLEPDGLGEQGLERSAGWPRRAAPHDHQQQARQSGRPASMGARAPCLPRRTSGQVLALGRAAARHGDPLRQVAVAAARLRQQHQARGGPAVRGGVGGARRRRKPWGTVASVVAAAGGGAQLHLRADDQRQAQAPRLGMRTHHTGERALVGDGQRGIAQRLARATSSSGCEAPVRKLKLLRQASSA
jgi:hypothetical protein